MHAESSWYFIKNNFHTKIAWRLNISLGKSPNSHDISDEAKVGQPPKTVPKMKRAGAPLWVHKQPHLIMSVSSLQTVASKRVAPSSHPQLDWPALGCSMCSLARIMLAIIWPWAGEPKQDRSVWSLTAHSGSPTRGWPCCVLLMSPVCCFRQGWSSSTEAAELECCFWGSFSFCFLNFRN